MAEPTEHIRDLQEVELQPTMTFPPGKSSWFSPERVSYVNQFAQMLFFLLALPYLIMRFFTSPFDTIRVVGEASLSTS